ncbi:probable flavin-containing monoamine oxidase A isoform X2 [Paramormyrops kingsleyae]|uniref:probable flavin-containing monoamine oxidase A isoform X2 n=1 Tax=Paramormyrops kingsleyae TaxID=1676925 RepID=UPI000CD62868|nr:probable flavin-containing monoamine oxidase A isoform X2 [Paramormyrops kingsleyae]
METNGSRSFVGVRAGVPLGTAETTRRVHRRCHRPNMSTQPWDVVIVGAGLSGLSAARYLRERDARLRVLLLEGKDRVGGRTVTLQIPAAHGDDSWDFGGQWVSSSQTSVMELIQELGLEVYPQSTTGKKVYHMGGSRAPVRTYTSSIPSLPPLALLDLTQVMWKIDRLLQTVCVEDPVSAPRALEYDSMTLHSFIERNVWTQSLLAVVKEALELSTRSVFGMEPAQMSFLYFLMYCAAAGGALRLLEATPGSAQEFRVKGGTQQLCVRLAELIGWENVRLSCAVKAIRQYPDGIQVHTSSDSFDCKAVIVTCPPHLAAQIEYDPALPTERQRLTQNMPVGHMIKFIVTYSTAFWRVKGFSGEMVVQPSEDCPICVTYDCTSPHGNPALVGFIAGKQAADWSHRAVEDRREAVIRSLARYLGPEASHFIHYAEKDWAKEDYSGGCPVNVMMPGMLTYYQPSLRRPCGRIYWAGTESATCWCGYMNGAIQSGQRAALEVLERLSPQLLSQDELIEARASAASPPRSRGLPPPWCRRPVCFAAAVVALGAALLLARHGGWHAAIGRVSAFLQSVGSAQLLNGLKR